MFQKKIRNGGFVFVEFAIALPLLVLLLYGLATVSLEIFRLGKIQLADYVLEEEAQYVIERITHEARAAKEIYVEEFTDDIDQIKIIYHTVDDHNEVYRIYTENGKSYNFFSDKDVLETQIFIPRKENGIYKTLNAKRQEAGYLGNPITGGNFFGDTKINRLKYFEQKENVLRIELEMESLVTTNKRKIKIVTAVYMPGCDKKVGLQHDE